MPVCFCRSYLGSCSTQQCLGALAKKQSAQVALDSTSPLKALAPWSTDLIVQVSPSLWYAWPALYWTMQRSWLYMNKNKYRNQNTKEEQLIYCQRASGTGRRFVLHNAALPWARTWHAPVGTMSHPAMKCVTWPDLLSPLSSWINPPKQSCAARHCALSCPAFFSRSCAVPLQTKKSLLLQSHSPFTVEP